MLIEMHILQNFSPSCLNRDDLNAPKDCEFGGVRRARISSQCFKRATRWNDDFTRNLENGIGTRTKLLLTEVAKYLHSKGKDLEEAKRVAEPVVSKIGSGVKEGRTAIALYLGHDEIARIGEAIEARFDELLAAAGETEVEDAEVEKIRGKKKSKKGSGSSAAQDIAKEIDKEFKPGTKAADIALFGRMIAEATNFNVDAAAQVAHSISTHAVPSEFDFFTAVDDLQPKEDPGAGMMGSQQFNSATFYRYANVHLPQLVENLGGDDQLAKSAALAYVHSFITAIPNAKQNSHAAQNPPDFVFVTVREFGQPLSLANAFANPVGKKNDNGLVEASAKKLAEYWKQLTKVYVSEGVIAAPYFKVALELEELKVDNAKEVDGLRPLLDEIKTALSKWSPERKS